MKDYFDPLALAREGAMDQPTLVGAISATFARGGTELRDGVSFGLTVDKFRSKECRDERH